jgi:uncharacterized cofD-like protein
MPEAEKHVVTIGGGTGTFVVLSGLKHIPNIYLRAIVSVADDGGSTGRLRDSYGFLPLGDARQALIALADDDRASLMRSLFGYRFPKGDINGHNFGNLFLTALTDILGSDAAAIEAASGILRVRGKVVPVSEKPATLVAHLENGETVVSEHLIDERTSGRSPIISLETKDVVLLSNDAEEAVAEADMIVLGPGDLYASTLANFAVSGLKEAVAEGPGKLIYIVNLFTKAGQTDGYSASRHVAEITRYAGRKPDAIIVHEGGFPDDILERYALESEFPVVDDLPQDASIIRGHFADVVVAKKVAGDLLPRSLIRHDSRKIAEALETLL